MMELSPLPESELVPVKSTDEEEEELDMLITDTDYCTELEVDQADEFDISKDIKPPPRWTCCGEISAGTLLRRVVYVCVGIVVLVAFFAMFTLPTPSEFGATVKASGGIPSLPNPTPAVQSSPLPIQKPPVPPDGPTPLPALTSALPALTSTLPAPSPALTSALPAPSPAFTSPDPSPMAPEDDRHEMRLLAARLQPRDWNISSSPKQFLHMHHMKTGGTSVDSLINCAISRWRLLTETELPYFRVSECAGTVERCISRLAVNDTQSCPVHSAAIMSYCASLDAVDRFGWGAADKFTILREPVDRVWSMYRYSLQSCYSCKTLPEVYAELDSGVKYSGVCGSQLLDHQAENMLSAATRAQRQNFSEQQLTEEAISNMNSRFAVIGLTGRFLESLEMITKVFPFLANNLTEVSHGQLTDTITCPITHANEGRPPVCGTLALDDSIRQLIKDHNKRDMQLYTAALVHFEKQKKILLDKEVFEEGSADPQTIDRPQGAR